MILQRFVPDDRRPAELIPLRESAHQFGQMLCGQMRFFAALVTLVDDAERAVEVAAAWQDRCYQYLSF